MTMTRTVLAVCVLTPSLAVVACGGGPSSTPAPAAAPAPAAPAKPAPLTAAERAQWYQDCWAQFNAKAWEKFSMCYAQEATSESVDSAQGTARGRDAIVKSSQGMVSSWPDVTGELQLVLQHGPHGVSVALWSGTHTGPLPGPDGKVIPATNRRFGFPMAHFVETDVDGRMAIRDAAYVDEGTVMAQLGVVKMPARPVAKPTGAKPTVVVARMDEAETKNAALVQTTFDAFNKHDPSVMVATAAPNFVMREVAQPMDMNVKQAAKSLSDLLRGFPDARIALSSIWGAGDYVVAMGTLTGTNTGLFVPMKAKTGKPLSLKFVEIFKVENGKIAEDWLFYNGAAFAAQLGMM